MVRVGRGVESGARVRVTHASGEGLVGVVGIVTHPFPGLMEGEPSDYVAGLYLDEEHGRAAGVEATPLGLRSVNLVRGDRFERVA